MIGKAEKKVQAGKLIKVKAEFDKTIKTIRITGDFFLHPEEAIEKIEQCLVGMQAAEPAEAFEKRIRETVEKNGIQMLGFSAIDIAETVKQAVSK